MQASYDETSKSWINGDKGEVPVIKEYQVRRRMKNSARAKVHNSSLTSAMRDDDPRPLALYFR